MGLNFGSHQVPDLSEPFFGMKPTLGHRKVLVILWDPKRPQTLIPKPDIESLISARDQASGSSTQRTPEDVLRSTTLVSLVTTRPNTLGNSIGEQVHMILRSFRWATHIDGLMQGAKCTTWTTKALLMATSTNGQRQLCVVQTSI